jgi:adenosine deaminase
MSGLDLAFIERLPKTDLHCHLDGSLRLESILDLAERQKIKLPAEDREGLGALIYPGDTCKSLDEYLKAFDITLKVLQTEEGLYRAAYELVEDCARENVRYLEVRFSPMLHQDQGLKLTQVVEAVLQGLRAGKRAFNVRSGVLLCAIRSATSDWSLRMAELCLAYKNRGVVGFDLAGAEFNYPAKQHREAFQLILKNNINCTVHAGEAYGPLSISQAIHQCGAHRIGHGTRLREGGDLLNYVNDHRIPLEICVSSNIQTGAARDFDSHPLPFYFNYGLRCTINTDNRLVTNTTVSKELWLCHQHYGFDFADIKELIVAGFKSAFLPYREKVDVLREVVAELDRLGAEHGEHGSQPAELLGQTRYQLTSSAPAPAAAAATPAPEKLALGGALGPAA